MEIGKTGKLEFSRYVKLRLGRNPSVEEFLPNPQQQTNKFYLDLYSLFIILFHYNN